MNKSIAESLVKLSLNLSLIYLYIGLKCKELVIFWVIFNYATINTDTKFKITDHFPNIYVIINKEIFGWFDIESA